MKLGEPFLTRIDRVDLTERSPMGVDVDADVDSWEEPMNLLPVTSEEDGLVVLRLFPSSSLLFWTPPVGSSVCLERKDWGLLFTISP